MSLLFWVQCLWPLVEFLHVYYWQCKKKLGFYHAKDRFRLDFADIKCLVCPCLCNVVQGVILGLRPTNERCRYKVTPSLIGWPQTSNQPCVRVASWAGLHIACCHWMAVETLSQSPCTALTAGICLPLGLCKGTVSCLRKMVGIPTAHMSPQYIATEVYLDQPITKGWCQPTRGQVTYPTDSPTASRLRLCNSLVTGHSLWTEAGHVAVQCTMPENAAGNAATKMGQIDKTDT